MRFTLSRLPTLARTGVAAAGLVAMFYSAQASADLVAFSALPALRLADVAVPVGLDTLVLSVTNTLPEPGALALALLACAATALAWRGRGIDDELTPGPGA